MRPEFHFTAEHGWINDPHGITAEDGRYHLFHQFVPDSMIWDSNCSWGHAVGDDLFSLHRRPVALTPGDGDDGVWSGALVRTELETRIFYTSTVASDLGLGRIRIARARDLEWDVWSKDAGIAVTAPEALDVLTFRDPFVLRHQDEWHMLVGASLRGDIAAALMYTSSDLDTWTYAGVAASRSSNLREPGWMGSLWECPQLFEIDGRHILLTSVWDQDVLCYAGYGVGTYAHGRFRADTWKRLSFGPSYYAPSFFRDSAGRPCLSFWMRGVRDEQAGWSGAHSLPHLLSLVDNTLLAAPHPDLDRYAGPVLRDTTLTDGHAFVIEWQPGADDRIVVRHGSRQTLRVEASKDALLVFAAGDATPMPYTGGSVRLIIDGPSVEVSSADGILGAPISATSAKVSIASYGAALAIQPLTR